MMKTYINKTLATALLLATILNASAQIKTTPGAKPKPEQTQIPAPDREGIELQPEFPGGQKAFSNYVRHNLKWPVGPRVNGKVLMGFVIEKDGSLSQIKVLKKLSPKFDAEAIRLLKSSPNWIPGRRNNGHRWKPVRIMMSLPINFSLN